MQKYLSLFFSALLFLTACDSNERPRNVLDQKAMINLLTDIHMVDGTLYTVPQVPDSLYKYSYLKFAQVFKKHHTTDAAFRASLEYYTRRPEEIQDMYNEIESRLKGKIDSLNKQPAPPAPTGKRPVAAPQVDDSKPAAAASGGIIPQGPAVSPAIPPRKHLPHLLHKPKTQTDKNAIPPK